MENPVVPSKEIEASKPANSEIGEAHNQPEETGAEHVITDNMENPVVPSKEIEASKPANSEIGEAHNQPEETGAEHVIAISDNLQQRFKTLMDSYASVMEEDKGHKSFIGQVPMLLAMNTELKNYLQPRIMSIGPVHHGKNYLEQGQQYKLQLTKRFTGESPQRQETIYKSILTEIESIKEHYDHQELLKFIGDDEGLAWMFFVDGCALIQFCKSYGHFEAEWTAFYYMNIDRDQLNVMATDLILLDNQLPLGVLNLIMGFSNEEDQCLRILIRGFAKEIMGMMHFEGWVKDEQADNRTDQTVKTENHMLELIRMNFDERVSQNYKMSCFTCFGGHRETYYPSDITKATSRKFRSVKDLQAAGIILEPNNSSSSLGDISFNRGIFFCKLKIPSFRVSEQGKFLVCNLIALEMHPIFDKDPVVTSYISFLDSLIETKEDVLELRKAGILFNYLPNDEEVLKTFQDLTPNLKPCADIFSDTKEELIRYFNDKKSMTTGKWLSEAMQVYFGSPWTTIAFISATFLLIFTIIQAIFSVLAYQTQRKNL